MNNYLTNKKTIQYFFLFLSQDTFEKDLPLEEILRERTFEYLSNNKVIDFWMISPFKFPNESFKSVEESNNNFYCFVTTNYAFFNFLRLRIGDFQTLIFSDEKKKFSLESGILSNNKIDGFSFSCSSNSSIFKELIFSKDKSLLFQKSLTKYQTIYNFLTKK
jgi:hypothetical protein